MLQSSTSAEPCLEHFPLRVRTTTGWIRLLPSIAAEPAPRCTRSSHPSSSCRLPYRTLHPAWNSGVAASPPSGRDTPRDPCCWGTPRARSSSPSPRVCSGSMAQSEHSCSSPGARGHSKEFNSNSLRQNPGLRLGGPSPPPSYSWDKLNKKGEEAVLWCRTIPTTQVNQFSLSEMLVLTQPYLDNEEPNQADQISVWAIYPSKPTGSYR